MCTLYNIDRLGPRADFELGLSVISVRLIIFSKLRLYIYNVSCIVYCEYTKHFTDSIQHKCILYCVLCIIYTLHISYSELYFKYIKFVYKINILYVHYTAYTLHIYVCIIILLSAF